MPTLRVIVAVIWAAFWIYWLVNAVSAKRNVSSRSGLAFRAVSLVCVIVLVRVGRVHSVAMHDVAVATAGVVLVVCGLGVAVWARVHLGRNWGMPMTQKAEPEIVTSGPYRLVRHPIYSGLLLALVGTALVYSVAGLIIVAVAGAYFGYATTVEERNLSASMPQTYPDYQARTKRLIPFVL